MKVLDILGMGFKNLLRRKTRTFLTIIGVVVGAAAIIIMISFGIGMNENLQKSIENMGDLTMIDIYQWAWRPPSGDNPDDYGGSVENNLNDELLEKIRSWDGVLAVTPYFNYWELTMKSGKRYENVQPYVVGIDSSFLPYLKLEIESGYSPQPGDTNWIIFGAQRARMFVKDISKMKQKDWEELYNGDLTKPPKINITKESIILQNPTTVYVYNPSTGYGEEKQLKGKVKKYEMDKVGVIKYQENAYGWDENSYNVYTDYRVVQELLKEYEKLTRVKPKDSRLGKYEQIRIKVSDIKTAEIIQTKLAEEGLMIENYLADMRDEMQKNQATVQILLGAIGAVSLIVAAIGIANTMFMSIYERTKEIGVMKVLGCPLSGIQYMFLFEASIIGFFGGLISCGFSLLGSYALNNVDAVKQAFNNISGGGFYNQDQGDISVIPLWLIVMAILFATVIGLVSGYLPARRATKISALEAIRNE